MTDREAALRYHWFCTIGYSKPTLNDPRVILDHATPEDIDRLIQEGMKRWPLRNEPKTPDPILPRCA